MQRRHPQAVGGGRVRDGGQNQADEARFVRCAHCNPLQPQLGPHREPERHVLLHGAVGGADRPPTRRVLDLRDPGRANLHQRHQ